MITADQARTLSGIREEAENMEDENTNMREIFEDMLRAILSGRKSFELEYLTNEEAKILLDGGFKIYSIDGTEQYTQPEGFTDKREVIIEW
jgi:hypothetical protein